MPALRTLGPVLVSIALAISIPVSCTPPAEAPPTAVGRIEHGVSTRNDVIALLGEPESRFMSESGLETWTYWSTETAGGAYSHTRVVVKFRHDGRVLEVQSSRVAP